MDPVKSFVHFDGSCDLFINLMDSVIPFIHFNGSCDFIHLS